MRVLVVTATALVVATAGMSVANADTVENHRNGPIVGNFTLDKLPDTATLGHDPLGCTIKVDRVYNYGLKSTKYYRYDIPGLTNPKLCPDMGVAVPTGKPWMIDDLVVTWFINYQSGSKPAAYVLRNFTIVSSFAAEDYPSYIGTGVDFNGDGLADIWERTDEGEGFRTYLRSGDTFVPGPAALHDSFLHEVFFGQLDGQPGTDIVSAFQSSYYNNLLSNPDGAPIFGPGPTGVMAISGATGKLTLLEPYSYTDNGAGLGHQFDIYHPVPTLVDINGDGILDVRVTGSGPYDGTSAPSVTHDFLNDGTGNFTLVP